MKKNKFNIAIVGATGMVGRKFLEVLAERNFPIQNLYLFASKKSDRHEIEFQNKKYIVQELSENAINEINIDIALFSAGGSISERYAPVFKKMKCVVIDNSSFWRMYDDVPLVVPEVNSEIIWNHKYIISNPNCSTIQGVIVLAPLHKKYKIKRIIYSTYQAVSGAGKLGCEDLINGQKDVSPLKFKYQIFNNCIPQIDDFITEGEYLGYTKEEMKMINETKKILGDENIKITATTVRVPVLNSHSESVNIEFEDQFELQDVIETLKNSPGIIVKDDIENCEYPMCIDTNGKDETFVGRIRRDTTVKSGLNLWIVADNIRKGAATNAVQIAETLIAH